MMNVQTPAATAPDLEQLKGAQRATWAAGDYAGIARYILDVGARLAARMEIAPGERVLDVACGSGNAAIPAAAAGGEVVGIDLTPELFPAARRLAEEAGVEVEWREGDAEALPFADDSFDVVLSTFGCMFAPRHAVAAREIARVVRPGGRIGICSWTPDGAVGEFFALVGSYLPPPPPFAEPPILWGDEAHVRRLFEGSGIELGFDREIVELRLPSIEAAAEEYATKFGPIVKARELLEPQGRWPALRQDLADMWGRHNTATDGTLVDPLEYLVVTGRRRADG